MLAHRSFRMLAAGAVILIATTACGEKEIDTKAIDDPLNDPWVAGLGSDDSMAEEPAPAEPAAGETGGGGDSAAAETGGGGDAETGAGETEGAAALPTTDPGSVAPGSNPTATANAGTGTGTAKTPGSDAAAAAEPGVADPAPTATDPAPTAVEPGVAPTPAPAATKPVETKPAEPAPITIADYAGSYRYAGGDGQRKALEQAIEDAVLQLNAAIRGIGRKRLTKTNPIDDGLEIKLSGGKIQTIFTTGFDAEVTLDGPATSWTSKKSGDKYKVRVVQKGNKLVQVIAGEDGVKTTVFVLSADKKRLTVNHKITSDRLQIPMTYKLSYSRK